MEGLLVLLALVVLAVPVLLVVVLVQLGTLRGRVSMLEEALERARRAPSPAVAPAVPAAATAPPDARAVAPASHPVAPAHAVPAAAPSATVAAPSPVDSAAPAGTVSRAPSIALPAAASQPSPRIAPVRPAPAAPAAPREPTPVDRAIAAVKRWFTEGNVPVKIGMLVLLAGVAALLKYASDQGWLRVPPELRYAGIAAAAIAGLVFAWRKRFEHRSFALSVQGGAIGGLLLVVFAAVKVHPLLPVPLAFALSVLLVAGAGVLAVAQNARVLAILAILAGFLAPIWLSTGGGQHVVLFGYYALLNAAIFAIAWRRAWRELNLLGFAFTWGIGLAWGVLDYDPVKYATTQPFLVLFFLFYVALPILHAWRRPADRGDRIDGTLLFGTPLVAFSLQAALLRGEGMPLAFCALGVAALYAVLAMALVRRPRFAVLGQAHAILAVGFATLAVPLALSARATASVFALEGAALVWLGFTQGRRLPRWTGVGLQAAAAVAFFAGTSDWRVDATAVANATFLSGLLIAIAGGASAWVCRAHGHDRVAAKAYAWALAWWVGLVLHEVDRFVDHTARADVLLAIAAVTGWLASEVHRRRPAAALAATSVAVFAVAPFLAFVQADLHAHPFAANGAWAWGVFALLGLRTLHNLRQGGGTLAGWAQFAWWLAWPAALSLLPSFLAPRFGLAQGWWFALMLLPWLALVAIAQWRWTWLAWPQGAAFDAWRLRLRTTHWSVVAVLWIAALLAAGGAAPLPWLPLLNPHELVLVAAVALLARWAWSPDAPDALARRRLPLLSILGFALVTSMTLRTVHAWGGLSWGPQMLDASLAQTSLTVVWSVLGVAGWIIGSRRRQRLLWLAGAVLMAVVLAKLVLVDRQHLGNLLGIGSFIAYGLLCTLVGWFAPAPPRAPEPDVAEASA